MNRIRHQAVPPIPSNANSVMRCYSLSKSKHAFQVVTPQIGYKAIFVRMPDETLMEPDVLLMMPHHNTIHQVPWMTDELQDQAYHRLEKLQRDPSAIYGHTYRLLDYIQQCLRPWPEPVEYYEAVTHLLGWLLGVRVMYSLEGKRAEERRVRGMVEEVEKRSGIWVEHGVGVHGRRWEAEVRARNGGGGWEVAQ